MKSQIQSSIERSMRMLGHEFEVYNFEYVETDEESGTTDNPYADENPYSDGEWVEAADTPVTTVGIIDFDSPDAENDESGVSVEHDAIIYLNPEGATVRDGTADETKGTEFVDTASGARYSTVAIEHYPDTRAIHVEER